MNKKLFLATILTLFSLAIHAHLSAHYYPLLSGTPSDSIVCNIGERFSCDAAVASPYGAIFGVPLSVLGAVFHAVLFLLILGSWMRFTDSPARQLRLSLLLSGGAVLASIVMGLISTLLLTVFCPLCIALYGLSAITFLVLLWAQHEPFVENLKEDIPQLWSESRASVILILSIPLVAFVVHKGLMAQQGPNMSRMINTALLEWKNSPQHSLNTPPSLSKGPEQARMVVQEFADFRCIHCKDAAPILDTFARAHSDVRLEFYSFPLDGDCNEAIPQGDGISCLLSKAVICAEQQEAGWKMHDKIFAEHTQVSSLRSTSALESQLQSWATDMNLEAERLQICLDAPETHEKIQAQAQAGVQARVRGTPAILVNGRHLPRGQSLQVLQGARRSLLSE